MNPTLFIHIPKAGGSSLVSIIEKQFKMNEILVMYDVHYAWPYKTMYQYFDIHPKRRAQTKMIVGHFAYNLHQYLNTESSYITMLRNPVKRVISNYKHMKRTSSSNYTKSIQSMSLLDFVKAKNWHDLDNGQVRRLCGSENEVHQVPIGECTENMLTKAKENLKNCLSVGIMEEFDKSILLFSKSLGWHDISYSIKNAAPVNHDTNNDESEAIKLITDINRFDIELYEYANELFNTQLNNYKITDEQLQDYQNNNKKISKTKVLAENLNLNLRSKKRAINKRLRNLICPF